MTGPGWTLAAYVMGELGFFTNPDLTDAARLLRESNAPRAVQREAMEILEKYSDDEAWHCPNCDEVGGEPVYLEGRSPSRWGDGDDGYDSFDGCSLCDPRTPRMSAEEAEAEAMFAERALRILGLEP